MERKQIDRNSTCPFLIRVFWQEGRDVDVNSLKGRNHEQRSDEARIYAWKDTNLREVIEMVSEFVPGARRRDAEFLFCLVRQDSEGDLETKHIGRVHGVRRGESDLRTLEQLRFAIGNFLTVSINYTLQ